MMRCGNWPRSRGTPRIAKSAAAAGSRFCAVEGNGKINLGVTKSALQLEGIDDRGLMSRIAGS